MDLNDLNDLNDRQKLALVAGLVFAAIPLVMLLLGYEGNVDFKCPPPLLHMIGIGKDANSDSLCSPLTRAAGLILSSIVAAGVSVAAAWILRD